MPKKIDYPVYSLDRCIELANAVDSLGGSCSKETVATKLGKKLSGAFSTLIGSAIKFTLIKSGSSGRVETTQLYKDMKLAYNDTEKRQIIIKSFLTPITFKNIYEKFIGKELPLEIFNKVLIKEYDVNDDDASIIAKNFLSGLKLTHLIDEKNTVLNFNDNVDDIETVEAVETIKESKPNNDLTLRQDYNEQSSSKVIDITPHDKFIFHIYGPGLDNTIQVHEEEDLLIVDAIIKKVKKHINANHNQ